MSWGHDDEVVVDDDFGRPAFLRGMKAKPQQIVSSIDEDDASDDMVRAYSITRGRTQADPSLRYETMVRATRPVSPELSEHERAIVHHVRAESLAVAELAVLVVLPIGVVRVLVGDLIKKQFLLANTATVVSNGPSAQRVDLLKRVISGVEAL